VSFNRAALEHNKDLSEIPGAQTFHAESQATNRIVGCKDASHQLGIAAAVLQ
jgi:hypothetical protein